MSNEHSSAAQPHRHALIVGGGSLATALGEALDARGIRVTFTDSSQGMPSIDPATTPDGLSGKLRNSPLDISGALAATEPSLSLIFNAWFPNPMADTPESLSAYPQQLLIQSQIARTTLANAHPSAAIINFAFLPAMYVGTVLEDHVASLRGGITGVTRTLARKFGKQGIRVSCVQAGFVEMAETRSWSSETVKKVQVPVKRWASATEVAKFMVFLGIDSHYTTGQTMIIDGGLTAGITGT